jgi:hypothetical protein
MRPMSAAGGSIPCCSSGTESADMVRTCAVGVGVGVGVGAARTVGAGGAGGTGGEGAHGSHRTAPNWEVAQTQRLSRARRRARTYKERRWAHMDGRGRRCWRLAGRAKGAKVEEEEYANEWARETPHSSRAHYYGA